MRLIDGDAHVQKLRSTYINEIFTDWDLMDEKDQNIILKLMRGYKDIVYSIPAVDAVPVVRCWDCKHGEPYKRTDGATGYYCHCKYNVFEYGDRRKYTPVRASDDYCSYGDRKETK